MSVIVPTYFENRTIPLLMDSLTKQTALGFELVIVDNGSRDDTVTRVLEMSRSVGYQVSVLTEATPGPGSARRTGIDYVADRLLLRDGVDLNKHIIASTDADCAVPPQWVETIIKTFDSPNIGVVGGTHTAHRWVDEKIEDELHIPNYFKSIAQFNALILESGLGRRKLSGPNTAFEIYAAIKAGGLNQPLRADGTVGVREIANLVNRIGELGFEIGYLPVEVVSSRRRHLMELIKGRDMYYTSKISTDTRFVTIRPDEKRLLNYALSSVPIERWLAYRRQLMMKILNNNLRVN